MASDRELTIDRLNEIADNLEIQNTEDAVRLGLVDSLFYRDQFQNHLANLMEQENYDDINFVSLKKYNKVKMKMHVINLKKRK